MELFKLYISWKEWTSAVLNKLEYFYVEQDDEMLVRDLEDKLVGRYDFATGRGWLKI